MKHKIFCRRTGKNLGFPSAHVHVKRAVIETLRTEGVDMPCEVSVLFMNDRDIAEINREHRSIDEPTDVLSFPSFALPPGEYGRLKEFADPETGFVFLGDIAISLERVEAQAEEFGHSREKEISYLTVHSVLHLLGYDHVDEGEDKRLMRGREKIIVASLGETEAGTDASGSGI